MFTHFPPDAVVTIWNIQFKLELSAHMVTCMGMYRGLSEVEHLSLRQLCKRTLEGGFFTRDPGGCVKKGSGDSISIWAPLGNLEGGLYIGDVAR
jgi:hypothetical protein